MMLSDTQLDRYARHIVLREIGGAGQLRLLGARVGVVGAGGIGVPVLQYLAAAGVGCLRVFDDDVVSRSNLQRQVIYTDTDIGRPKLEAAAAVVARINPDTRFEGHPMRVTADTARDALSGLDVVIDGSDNFATRLAVADAALVLRIPLVSAAVGSFEGQLAVYRGWETTPPCYRCFVGDDPDRPEISCADQGVIGALTGILGSMAALEAVRALVPFGEDPAGRLLLLDTLGFRFRTLTIAKDPGCRCATK